MVGMTGFEPATPLTPSSRDSRPDTSTKVYCLEIRQFTFQCGPLYPPAATREAVT